MSAVIICLTVCAVGWGKRGEGKSFDSGRRRAADGAASERERGGADHAPDRCEDMGVCEHTCMRASVCALQTREFKPTPPTPSRGPGAQPASTAHGMTLTPHISTGVMELYFKKRER